MSDAQLLLVEDDPRLADLLTRTLEAQGFAVRWVANIAGMQAQLAQRQIDLIVLDLGLPDGDGLLACRDLRASGVSTPVLILTARGDDIDRIIGLEIGADDYLGKPCNPRELVARVRAVLRRSAAAPGAGAAPQPNRPPIRFGPWQLDPTTRSLSRDEGPVPLTSGEFALLHALASHPHRPLTREQLQTLAFGRDHEASDRAVDVMVSKLRKLIEDDPRAPQHLQTVWGHGYVFVPGTRESA